MRRVCGVWLATVIAAQVLSASAAPLDAMPHGLQDVAPQTLSSGLSADESLMFDLPPADAPAFGSPGWMPQAVDAAPNDASTNAGHETAPTPSGSVIKLAAPPAGLLLMLQGVLCIGFFRGRRKWAALLVGLLSVGRTGLAALPRLFASPAGGKVAAPPAAQPLQAPALGWARGAPPSAELDFIGLLRRLQAAPASRASGTLCFLDRSTAVAGSQKLATASLFSQSATLPCVARVPESRTSVPVACAQATGLHPPQDPAFALFARPPPCCV